MNVREIRPGGRYRIRYRVLSERDRASFGDEQNNPGTVSHLYPEEQMGAFTLLFVEDSTRLVDGTTFRGGERDSG